MRNAVFLLVGTLFVVALLPSVLVGCGDSCEDLQEICDRCTDLDYRASCDSTVTQGNQSLCDARKPTFNEQCPFVLTTSSTTTTAVGPGVGGMTNTGGSTANGGAGGTMATGGAGGTAGGGGT